MNRVGPTAGEWKASGLGIYSTVDGVYAGGIGRAEMEDAITYGEACRNADLFAASKDLLAACEETLALLHLVGSPSDPVQSSVEQLARAAIAKAKGGP